MCQNLVIKVGCRGKTMVRPTHRPASHSPSRAANYYPIPIPRERERERGHENDDRSAANWPASKSDSIRPLARSFVLQFRVGKWRPHLEFGASPSQPLLLYSFAHPVQFCVVVVVVVVCAPELTKMISITFVHSNAALVCPLLPPLPPPPPSRSL